VSVVTDNAGNVISDKDYSQAVPSGNAPATLRMPSQGEMNAMAAAQSARNEASVGGNRLLNVALKDAIGKASRLPDEE
jgi:hypothetical protein